MTDESSTSTGARDAKSRPISDLLAEIQADIADNASSGSARRIRQPGVSGSGDGGGTTLMPGDNEDVAELEREMERALQKSSGCSIDPYTGSSTLLTTLLKPHTI
eukprot:1331844-Amorphochlora_amoeboformis.AAC.3